MRVEAHRLFVVLTAWFTLLGGPLLAGAAETTDSPASAPEVSPSSALAATGTRTADAGDDTPQPAIPVDTPPGEITLRLLPMTADELAIEADAWIRSIQALTSRIVEIKIALASAAEDPARGEALKASLVDLDATRRAVFKGFDQVLASWEAKGGDPEAIARHRKFTSALRAEEIKATNTRTLFTTANEWLVSEDGGVRILWKLAAFVVALFVIWALARIVSRLVRRAVSRWDKFSTLLDRFLVRASFYATLVLGILTVLSWLGLRMTPILTLLGGLSFVAAFAMQSTLSNFAAGLLIMIYRPFDVGNVVTLAGVTGKVTTMNMVSTTLLTGDNQVIVVPNSNVWGSIITNVNVSETRRVDLVFSIGYDDDAAEAQRILEDVVAAHPLVLKDPAPVIRMNELADLTVRFICRPWVKTGDYSTVFWDITQQVKERFNAAGIFAPAKALVRP